MMTPICPRLLNLINDFVLLRFRARAPEDLSAIEVILLLLFVLLLLLLLLLCTWSSIIHMYSFRAIASAHNLLIIVL